MEGSIKSPGFILAAADTIGILGMAAYSLQKMSVVETELAEVSKRVAGIILKGESSKPQKDKQTELEEMLVQLTAAFEKQKKILLRELDQKDEEIHELRATLSDVITKLQAGSLATEFKGVILKPMDEKKPKPRHQRRPRRRYDDDDGEESSNDDISAVRRNR